MNTSEQSSGVVGICPAGNNCQGRLDREAINSLPLFRYPGRISLIRTDQDMAEALDRLCYAKEKEEDNQWIMGFDTETRPSFHKGKVYAPSLIQLAIEDEVFLFHCKWRPFGSELMGIFENPHIIKAGVAIYDDMRFLTRLLPFTPAGLRDLGEIASKNHIENRGLRGLAAAFLGLRISKGERCSNWANSELSSRQICYAATDAWVSRAVYIAMCKAGFDCNFGAPDRFWAGIT